MKTFHLKTKFTDVYVNLRVFRYTNGNIALRAFDAEDGMPVMTLTVNPPPPDNIVKDDCICVKDYSENTGLVDCLVLEGFIDPNPVRFIPSGHINLPVYQLTPKAIDFLKDNEDKPSA